MANRLQKLIKKARKQIKSNKEKLKGRLRVEEIKERIAL